MNRSITESRKEAGAIRPGSGGILMNDGTQLSPPPLEVHDLTVAYHKRPVLYGIDLTVPTGSLVGIIGPNGAGKSTFIKAIMGLLPLSCGWVKIFGKSFRESCHRVGYVPQRESVDWDFPVSVMDVVLMGRYGRLRLAQRPTKQDREIARECLEKVKMLPFANRQIGNLSGGQQQRVFLARALAQESDLYLMDEPFAGVDAATEIGDHHAAPGAQIPGQDAARRASRSGERARVFRHAHPAEHAARGLWSDQ